MKVPQRLTKQIINPRLIAAAMAVAIFMSLRATGAFAYPTHLTASWYAVADLKSSGQWKITKGVMANGEQFKDDTRVYALDNTQQGVYTIKDCKELIKNK
jgi:hypothetical protein